jgi:hypothetical protein
MSRLMREVGPRVSRFGRSVATRYALAGEIAGLGRQVTVFRVDEDGRANRHGVRHFLTGDGCWLEPDAENGQLFDGLPPFVEDMGPQCFIGRGFSALYPELRERAHGDVLEIGRERQSLGNGLGGQSR